MKIKIAELIGIHPVSYNNGDKLYSLIKDNLGDEALTLDFSEVEFCATPFFNSSVSRLLSDMTVEECQSKVRVINIKPNDKALLNISFGNAINFYSKNKKGS